MSTNESDTVDKGMTRQRAIRAAREARNEAAGKCRCGGGPKAPGRTRCARCVESNASTRRVRRAERRARGVCECGREPRAGFATCSRCAAQNVSHHKKRREDRRAAGMCQCGTESLLSVGQVLGRRCLARTLARVHTGSADNADALLGLLEAQGNRCPLSGSILTLGFNASVDHILPLARGGKRELSNVRWLDHTTNMCRRDLTDDEFVSLCLNVIVTRELSAARREE